jgi:xanthine dehydrogenase/oxidase
VPADQLSGVQKLYHALPKRFSHDYEELRTGPPSFSQPGTSVGDSEPHLAALKQVTGEALYVDDRPASTNELKGFLVTSKIAHGKIISIDTEAAMLVPGVKAVITHNDVPGKKAWGDIYQDEEIFASEEVHHYRQPIAMVVADTAVAAKKAASLVQVNYQPLEEIFTIDQAIQKQSFFEQCKPLIKFGQVEENLETSDIIVEGEMKMGGQEHFYFEPHSTLVVPADNDYLVYSSTQNANKTQKYVAAALGLPMNRVTTHVSRLGGGFGGKETRNIGFAAAAAVAAHTLRAPVRLVLERDLDMTITGGRHPFKFTYKAGASKDGKIQAADVKLWSNGGFSFDLSGPVLERAVLFCDGCYNWPALRSEGRICKTNMPSNTAFRGFGGPQGQVAAETMIDHLATALGYEDPAQLREQNLYEDGDKTYYGQVVTKNIRASWQKCKTNAAYAERREAIQQYNSENKHRKRGIVLLPSKYGIAFTFYTLNQGGALVHVYTDGSVLVSHGGVEMGQGLHTKVAQTVATELGIPVSQVHIREMATDKVANAPPTAASLGSDTYAFAALDAAKQINARLSKIRERNPGMPFAQLASEAFMNRINLSANGFFRSEHKGFNWESGTGEPWRYFTLGTACVEVEIDCLTGDFKNLRTDMVVDIGKPINPAIDIGQIEGAFVQGAGLYTIEELVWGDDQHPWVHPRGRNATSGPGNYKIPSADDVPLEWNIEIMKDSPVP